MELGCAVLTVDGQTSLKGNEQSEQVSKEQRAVCVGGRGVGGLVWGGGWGGWCVWCGVWGVVRCVCRCVVGGAVSVCVCVMVGMCVCVVGHAVSVCVCMCVMGYCS